MIPRKSRLQTDTASKGKAKPPLKTPTAAERKADSRAAHKLERTSSKKM